MKNKQFTLGALLSYGAIAFNIVSGLLFTPWMVGTLGDDQYALYTLAVSVINIFLMDFGIGSAVTKFLSNYYAKKQYDEAGRFMGIVYKVFIAISGLIALVLFVFYFFIDVVYVKLTADEVRVFKHLFIIVAAYSVLSFPFTPFNGVLTANERFIELKLCGFLQKFTNVLFTLVFLLMGYGVYALVLIHAFTNFFFLIAKYFFIRRNTRQRAALSSWDTPVAKSLFGYSVWTTVMSLAQRCMFNIMPSVIAALIGSAEVTLFSLASTLEGYVYTFSSAINGMLMPKISRILQEPDAHERLTDLMIKIGKYHVCTIGLLYVGFACVGLDFVVLWLGEGYELVYWGALALIFPSLLSTPQQVANTALLVKDVVKEQAIIYVGMALINVTFSVLLLSYFGVVGASVSIAISYLFCFVCKNRLYKKKLPVKLGTYFKKVYGRWSLIAVGVCALYYLTAAYIPFDGIVGFLLKVGLVTFAYMGLYIPLCLDADTRRRIVQKILRKRT